jgi:hypothetical protein
MWFALLASHAMASDNLRPSDHHHHHQITKLSHSINPI